MSTNTIAKIGGWSQFGLQVLQTLSTTGTPHGLFAWVAFVGSLLSAVGIHAASESAPAPKQ